MYGETEKKGRGGGREEMFAGLRGEVGRRRRRGGGRKVHVDEE